MKNQRKHPVFVESMSGVLLILFLGTGIFLRGYKTKSDFHQTTGKIVYYSSSFEELPIRHKLKYRYIKIDTYPKVFEVFIGKDIFDFKPKFERIDKLKFGVEVTIYYDETTEEKDQRLNRLLQFIDKDKQPYFVLGNKNSYFGTFLIITGVGLGLWILKLKKSGKIE